MGSDIAVRIRQPLIILVTFVVAGLGSGWLWHHLWAPAPTGFAFKGKMLFQDDVVFRGTGLYLLIAVAVGVVLGALLTYLLERDEVLTLAAVILGALVAGVVMARFGSMLGPDSPQAMADSLTREPGQVTGNLSAHRLAVFTSFPGGAVLGALFVLITFSRRAKEPIHDGARLTVDDAETESTDLT